MTFVGLDLAQRIEAAEARGLVVGAKAVAVEHPVTVRPFAGGVAVMAGPDSPLSKITGLGWTGPLELEALQEIEALFLSGGAVPMVELCHLADPAVAQQLSRRGYVLKGYENLLGRGLQAIAPSGRASPIQIRRADRDALQPWLDIMVDGFMAPDTQGLASHESFDRAPLAESLRLHARAAGYERYTAHLDGEAVGAASLRRDDGIAQLCGAATLGPYRRRGVHSALLAHRLVGAAEAGCDVAVLTCQPASKSQQNAQRNGFELLYTRAILAYDGPAKAS